MCGKVGVINMSAVDNYNNLETFHRLGTVPNGQLLYEVVDVETKKYKKYTVPKENADTFEKITSDISEKYKDFNSQKFAKEARIVSIGGTILGGTLGLILARKLSVAKQILSTIAGALTLGFGSAIIYSLTKFNPAIKYAKQITQLGVRQYDETADIKNLQEIA